jgi:hypothetical protein
LYLERGRHRRETQPGGPGHLGAAGLHHPLEHLEDDGLLIVVSRASYGDGLAASLR